MQGRRRGRDLATGFRTPHGVDFAPVGGALETHSGSDIQRSINPDFVPKTRPAEKVQIAVGPSYEPPGSYKTDFVEVLVRRPLEQAPRQQLHLTLTTRTIGAFPHAPPFPRTNRTSLVPPLVLSGHAASLTPYAPDAQDALELLPR